MRARNPYPALVVAALAPGLLLGAIWKYAEGKRPAGVHVSAGDGSPVAVPPVMNTPLLSVRRAPSLLTVEASEYKFTAALQPLLEVIGETACVSVTLDDRTIAARNDTTPLDAAHAQQLIIGAVALDVLGGDFQFSTQVKGDVAADGVVSGDLYLVGGGDPLLTTSWWNGSNLYLPLINTTSLEELADGLTTAGVTLVKGAVVGDATIYDSEETLETWSDEARAQVGPVSALVANNGQWAEGRTSSKAALSAAMLFTDLLRQRGIKVWGEPRSGRAASTMVLANVRSKPLSLIVQEMLTIGDGTTAEMLLKHIGIGATGVGTREAGLAVVKQKLIEWGVDVTGMDLIDGSGLSFGNRVTCRTLMQVLQHGSIDDAVGSGMPLAGQFGGRLAGDFPEGDALNGKFRGVTGAMVGTDDGFLGLSGVKSLAGYLPMGDGRVVRFVLILNGGGVADSATFGPIWSTFTNVMAAYLATPTVTDLGPR